ncbi:SbtR family transcriptional regulator [Yinghuangia sp. ASG 101]|uniref:SbtR family transcriptional regulator n=1 Tax=Yinghuangia sp. ASG 101 TaxID=2896848 RepID=UPI002F90D9A7
MHLCHQRQSQRCCGGTRGTLGRHAPEEALRRFLLLLVDHAAVGKGMSVTLESIMATDSPFFDDARTRRGDALTRLLAAGSVAGTVRGDVTGPTLLRASGGVCAMRVAEGWLDEARKITALLLDGLRHGAPRAT